MERMEKWFAGLKDRPLLQAGIGAVCLALLLLYIAFPYTFTKTYTPDEITPELCEKIYRDAYDTDEGMFHFIGMVQADDEIIAGLVIYLSPRSFTSPHAIWFYKIEEKNGEYAVGHISSSHDFTARIFEPGGGPSDWLVIINMNPEFDRIVGEESGKTLLQADPEQYPAIYAIPEPNESYVYVNKEGKEL